jgi:hypothetical protein
VAQRGGGPWAKGCTPPITLVERLQSLSEWQGGRPLLTGKGSWPIGFRVLPCRFPIVAHAERNMSWHDEWRPRARGADPPPQLRRASRLRRRRTGPRPWRASGEGARRVTVRLCWPGLSIAAGGQADVANEQPTRSAAGGRGPEGQRARQMSRRRVCSSRSSCGACWPACRIPRTVYMIDTLHCTALQRWSWMALGHASRDPAETGHWTLDTGHWTLDTGEQLAWAPPMASCCCQTTRRLQPLLSSWVCTQQQRPHYFMTSGPSALARLSAGHG